MKCIKSKFFIGAIFLVLVFLLSPNSAKAAPAVSAHMVVDINTSTQSSNPSNEVNLNGVVYFAAYDPVNSTELWKTDGTAEGTVMVKDIYPGVEASSPQYLTVFNGEVYFNAYNDASGSELWKTDGTTDGTVMVKDINPGSNGSSPIYLTVVGDTLYFSSGTNSLWKTDGTAEGTVMVKEVSISSNFTLASNTLFFVGYTAPTGVELWKSDGTADGTVMVKDINVGVVGSVSGILTAFNNDLFFSASDGVNGWELWKSDGTTDGTVMVKDIVSGVGESSPQNFVVASDTLFFSANNDVDGRELWKSDGTTNGTVMVKDINSGINYSDPSYLTAVGNELYFLADDGSNGQELWKSDGSSDGTVMVKDINIGVSNGNLSYLTAVDGTLFFYAYDTVNKYQLWKSDGTEFGTTPISNINSEVNGFYMYNTIAVSNILYFCGSDGTHGVELWKSDGNSVSLVKDINTLYNDAYPSNITAVNNAVYFGASDGVNSQSIWKSDGTANGTVLFKKVDNGPDESYKFLSINSTTTFFNIYMSGFGEELWKTDGTTQGTVLVKDIYSGSASSYPNNFILFNNELFFSASDGTNYKLWKSDGTEIGTVALPAVNPSSMVVVSNTLYFSAYDDANGYELWKSDGTTDGTVLVKDVFLGPDSSNISYLTAGDNELYFTASDGVSYGLWKSDGTEIGTVALPAVNPNGLAVVSNTIYFSAYDDANGFELWKSDGTADGTAMVKDIYPGSEGSSPQGFVAIGSELYFSAIDDINGRELWKTDGTLDGTIMIKDIWPGLDGSSLYALTVVGNKLLFIASDDTHGSELWQSDGTSEGTFMVDDIYPGINGSNLSYLTTVGNTLFFNANDSVNGAELWSYSLASLSTPTDLAVSQISTSSAQLNWSLQDGTQTELVIQISSDNVSFVSVSPTPTSTNSLVVDSSLFSFDPNTQYWLRVVASSSVDGTATSDAASFFTSSTDPSNAIVSEVSTSSVFLSWGGNGNPVTTSYQVLVNDIFVSTSTNSTSTNISGLTPNYEYVFTVKSINNDSSVNSPGVTTTPTTTLVQTDFNPTVDAPTSTLSVANISTSTINVPLSVNNAVIDLSSLTTANSSTLPGPVNVSVTTPLGAITVMIPAGTKISAADTWDGIINLPTIKLNNSVNVTPDSGKTASVSAVVEVGYNDVGLTMDKGVRLFVPGMANYDAGYYRDTTFTKISNTCSADTQTVGDELSAGGDCKMGVGNDLVIWTKHFTKFIAYSQTTIPVQGSSGGGGSYVAPAPIAPSNGNAEFIINQAAAFTTDRNVVLNLNSPQAAYMAISENKDFANASFEPYQKIKSWKLSEGLGAKTVYVKLRTALGGEKTLASSISLVVTVVAPQDTTPQDIGSIPASVEKNIFKRNLSAGMISSDVKQLQIRLKQLGYFKYPTFTNKFGAATRDAVKSFQKANKISPVNGIFNTKTRGLMNSLNQEEASPVTPIVESTNFIFKRNLSAGMINSDVKQLQIRLKQLGYFNYPIFTNKFGAATRDAVKTFQKAQGVKPANGVFGLPTRKILNDLQ